MKWKGMGEFKALHSLTEVARLNGGVSRLDGTLLFGKSYETAMETLEASDPHHPELRFDSIYPHVHFLPLDGFGARLLGILTLPNWQERLLDLRFEPPPALTAVAPWSMMPGGRGESPLPFGWGPG